MRALLARLVGVNRPKVIAVFGANRAEVESAVVHARTASVNLPLWVFCAEDLGGAAEGVPGSERVIHAIGAKPVRSQLRQVWPALSIVAWTGKPGLAGLKWIPFTVPPFRVVAMNEAGGFFAARPAAIAIHLKRRVRDACIAGYRRIKDWSGGTLRLIRSFALRTINWFWEFLLAVLGFLAQWTGPLSYRMVARIKHGRPREIPLEPASGGQSLEVAVSNRGWPRRKVVAAAAQSNVDYIVFRMKGERDSPAPLITMARKTNAFGAARQSAHSAWRRSVVKKHPFRRLQQDEIAEVFAPFSTLLVVRRDALLRLGIPRALTFGAALMILFWKSAAAGFQSVVVGGAGPVPDESAMLLEDAEFALRLTLSRRLPRLGPGWPALLRGNIAFSPPHRRHFRGNPRILIVSPYLPFPLSHGGAVRIYNLCSALSEEVDFVLACFREAGEAVRYDELHRVFREVYVVDADEKCKDPAVPNQVAEYRNTAMAALIEHLCRKRAINLVQLEYTQLAEYRKHTGGVPLVLVEHDITFTLYHQLAEFNSTTETREQYRRWLAFETEALRSVTAVWTVSDQDRALAIEHGAPMNRTKTVPNGVDLRRFTPAPKSPGPPVILFVGSFRHLPNLLAFESLRESIMPAVWRECPDAVLHVIGGPQHERAVALARKANLLQPHPRIVLDGFVEDVRQSYRDADLVVVPLPISAGTNIKLFEAMACGRAIVSTPAGCHGLQLENGRELIVSELNASFSQAIIDLLRDEDRRAKIALHARNTAERRFGWNAIARRAMTSYSALLEKPIPLSELSSAEHIESSL